MKNNKYDYLIVGTGLYGATFAYLAKQQGKKCLVIEKRKHIGGNIYCENIEGINVHIYGAHIFHTSNKKVWKFINKFSEFNNYVNSPLANYKGQLFNLPFNMNTFYSLWKTKTPNEALAKIEEQRNKYNIKKAANLEEQALSLVGEDIYECLIKHYTEKQWGRKCTELPSFIIKRLPLRFTYSNNYFNDIYQGIPIDGYNSIIENMLDGVEVKTNTNFFDDRNYWLNIADKIVYTGPIDEYFNYCYGQLDYRTVRFETEILNMSNYQGNAVVNYTDAETPYTRVIEHKHFEFGTQSKTVISKEYSEEWNPKLEPFYPVNDNKNNELYLKYRKLTEAQHNVIFGGRLAEYKYYDMDKVIEQALLRFSDVKY
ncbi:UDP-galactopyranose mutase [Dysgonomonadaceae bacterium PH5-43]|nr:UDP-galactopyranose mutase [Dysgonomonadaceae bacterium PH5-43]